MHDSPVTHTYRSRIQPWIGCGWFVWLTCTVSWLQHNWVFAADCDLKPYGLKLEHMLTATTNDDDHGRNVVTIRPDTSPRFSFQASSDRTPAPEAIASQVQVVRCTTSFPLCADTLETNTVLLWDSGWVMAGRKNGLDITPPQPLKNMVPMEQLHWRARFGIAAENSNNETNIISCPWSTMYESFLVGPSEEDWAQSEWICGSDDRVHTDCDYYDYSTGSHSKVSAPIFRTEFELPSTTIKSARLFVTGLGHYEAWMNGIHINRNRYLDPAPSAYEKRIYYNSFDVTKALVPGLNQSFGFLVGNGWWNPLPMKFWGGINLREALTVGTPRVRCILQVEFDDEGTEPVVVVTNNSSGKWMVADSGLLRNDLYLGNVVDLDRNRLLDGWSTVGFNSPVIVWAEVQSCPASSSPIPSFPEPQPIPPIRSRPPHVLRPRSISTIDHDLIMDMGINTAAAVHVEIVVPNDWVCSEQQIELKFGELLFPNGTVNVYTSVAYVKDFLSSKFC
jgi:Alpha-L-rhamnosidase N-terminal domain